MRPVRVAAVLVGLAVVVSSVGAAGVPVGASGAPVDPAAARGQPAANATEGSLGAHLSSFMQSNAARTDDAVETEMWVAAYEGAGSNATRTVLVDRQTVRLERRIERLRERKRALEAARRNGTIPPVAYRAQMSQIAGRLAALTGAINETERRAVAVGRDAGRLETLRQRANGVARGPVRRIARGLAGENRTVGPPGLFGPDRRGPPGGANATRDSGAGGGGPPNGTAGGPPDHAGNGSSTTSGSSKGGGRGSGRGNADGGSGNNGSDNGGSGNGGPPAGRDR